MERINAKHSYSDYITQFTAPNVTDSEKKSKNKKKRRKRKKRRKKKEKEKERKKLVQISTHYVELKKDHNKGFLFQWTPTISSGNTEISASKGSTANALFATFTATIENLFPKLTWAKGFGFARILHNSNILVEDGKKGQIHASRNIPVTIHEGTQLVASSVATGLDATITPNIRGARKDMVHMDIKFEVSAPAGQFGGKPVTTKHTVVTNVYVRSTLSAAIGGLASSFLSKDYNRLPASSTGKTPLVNLVSGKNYDVARSQFVVFITPVIKSSASIGVDRVKDKFKIDQD